MCTSASRPQLYAPGTTDDMIDTFARLSRQCTTFDQYIAWARLPGNPAASMTMVTLKRCFNVQRDAVKAERDSVKMAKAVAAERTASEARRLAEREAARQEQLRVAHIRLLERKATEAQEVAARQSEAEHIALQEQLKAKAMREEKSTRKKQMRRENKARKKAPLPFIDERNDATGAPDDDDS